MELERLKDKQVCNTIDSNANQELRRHRRNRELSNLRKLIQMDLPSSSLVILLSVMRRKNEQINQYIAVALLMSFTQSIVIAIISISLNDNLECTVLIDSRKNWGTKGYSRVFSGWPIARTSISISTRNAGRKYSGGHLSPTLPVPRPNQSLIGAIRHKGSPKSSSRCPVVAPPLPSRASWNDVSNSRRRGFFVINPRCIATEHAGAGEEAAVVVGKQEEEEDEEE